MTKKHYERIASIIHMARTSVPRHNHEWWIAENLADYFAEDNPRFDRERFLKACGIETHCNKCDCGRVASIKDHGHHDDCSIYKNY